MPEKRIIAVAGGIGSGKSVVSTILRIIGFNVYDCDSEAKKLMNTSVAIKSDLIEAFGTESVNEDGTINAKHLSSVVFKDKSALNRINSIVHPRVKEDILSKLQSGKGDVMFIETAILMQSNLIDIISGAWIVTAPEGVRVERVMKRNGMSREDVLKRIEAQKGQDYTSLKNIEEIINDGITAVLPQVESLLRKIGIENK